MNSLYSADISAKFSINYRFSDALLNTSERYNFRKIGADPLSNFIQCLRDIGDNVIYIFYTNG